VLLKKKGYPALPTYVPIPEHQKMKPDELVLTTYKVAVHIHSRSSHRKWLSEMYHDNPGWINSKTASSLGIKDGDRIKVKSSIGEIVTTANVNEKIVPGVIAIAMHLGREESGRYASGKKTPLAHDNDPDLKKHFEPIAKDLEANLSKILEELKTAKGKPQDLGGYYRPDPAKLKAAMRPSATFNAILDRLNN